MLAWPGELSGGWRCGDLELEQELVLPMAFCSWFHIPASMVVRQVQLVWLLSLVFVLEVQWVSLRDSWVGSRLQ